MEKINEKDEKMIKREMNLQIDEFFSKMLGKQLIEIELLKRKIETLNTALDATKGYNNIMNHMITKDAELKLEIKSIINKHNKLVKEVEEGALPVDELNDNFKRFLDLEEKIK